MKEKKPEDWLKDEESQAVMRVKRYMTWRYILGLFVLACLASSAFFFTRSVIVSQENNASVINIAGRQRMLSQRIALYSTWYVLSEQQKEHQEIREDLQEAVRLMEASHQNLIVGDKDINLPGIRSSAIRSIYYNEPHALDKSVRLYLQEAKALLASPSSELQHDNKHLSTIQGMGSEVLLSSLNEAVEQYEREARADVIVLQERQRYTLFLTLGFLVFLAVFVFAPMVRRVVGYYREAYHANRSKSDFLATMSHEMRTPLNGIIGSAELLLKGKLGNKETRHMQNILYSAESLLDIIDDILNFSTIEAGQIALEEAPFNMQELLQDSVRLLRLRAQEKGVEMIVRYKPGTPEFFIGDAGRIRQVVFNIAGNAIKFSEHGHVAISIEETHPHNYRNSGKNWIKISIEDTGVGIPEEKRVMIFDKFTQVDSSYSRQHGGTGLGLAICKKLVEMMGGEIGVDSTLGKGSTFWFALPLAVDVEGKGSGFSQKIVNENEEAYDFGQLIGKSVLLVEDNHTNRMMAEEMLEDMGCVVGTAENGKEAIEILERTTYELVVMDCQMPKMNGFEAAERIRDMETAGEIKGRIPIVALTANAMKGDREKCLAAGMDDYLAKPVRKRQFQDMLVKWLLDKDDHKSSLSDQDIPVKKALR